MVARWGGVLKGLLAQSAGGTTPAVLTAVFLDSDHAGGTSVPNPTTFSGLSFGTAAANRLLVAAVCTGTGGSSNSVPSAVTIGGIAATLVKGATVGEAQASIWQALVPSGTSGTVVVNLGSGSNTCTVGLWSVKTDKQAAQNSGSSITGASIAAVVPTNGYGIVTFIVDTDTHVDAGDSITPSGYTEDWDIVPHIDSGGSTVGTITDGGHITASATIDASSNVTAVDQVLVYASWGP